MLAGQVFEATGSEGEMDRASSGRLRKGGDLKLGTISASVTLADEMGRTGLGIQTYRKQLKD